MKIRRVALVIVVSAALLAGCGSSEASHAPASSTTVPQLRSDLTLDEFVNAVCSNPDRYFDKPTYIQACAGATAAK
jgi:hypothetical protein